MNLLLLEPDALRADGGASICGEPVAHIVKVLDKGVGDSLVVGVLDGQIGQATITAMTATTAELQCSLCREPPPPSPVTLVVALPRPPMLRRVLSQATAMGVKQIHVIQTARVDKSYWGTPSLTPDKLGHQLRLGLTQAVDTVLPTVTLHRRFRPFVEDTLPEIAGNGARLVADLQPGALPLTAAEGPTTIVVGPEGGFVDFERECLALAHFRPVSLGPRVLRVETAVVAVLARLG